MERRRSTTSRRSSGAAVEFSAAQLDQLRGAVRAAFREELRAHIRSEGWCQDLQHGVGDGAGGRPAPQGARTVPEQGGLGILVSRFDPGAAARAAEGKVADVPVATEEGLDTESVSPSIEPGGLQSKPTGMWGYHKKVGRFSNLSRSSPLYETANSQFIDDPFGAYRAGDISLQEAVRLTVRRVVYNTIFDCVFGLLITVNCICIGIEVQLKLDNADVTVLAILEHLFLICFIIEAGMRVVADGKTAFQNRWFLFDVALIACGVLISWVIQPTSAALGITDVPVVSQALTLRIIRLLRTVRAFRMIDLFSDICKLCSGLLRSARTMLSISVLVLTAIFSFAIIGVDLITTSEILASNDETHDIVQTHFASLPSFMMTLMQFANGDSIGALYFPLCQEQPLLVLYFLVVWVVLTVALMNLVTAILVENSLSMSREEHDTHEKRSRLILTKNIPCLEDLFNKLDKDGSGTITFDEIRDALLDGSLRFPCDVATLIDPRNLVDMFEFLDSDKSGSVDQNEFVDGVCCLALSSVSVQMMQALDFLRHVHQMLLTSQSNMESLMAKMP